MEFCDILLILLTPPSFVLPDTPLSLALPGTPHRPQPLSLQGQDQCSVDWWSLRVQGCTHVSATAVDDNGVRNARTRVDLIVVDGLIYL